MTLRAPSAHATEQQGARGRGLREPRGASGHFHSLQHAALQQLGCVAMKRPFVPAPVPGPSIALCGRCAPRICLCPRGAAGAGLNNGASERDAQTHPRGLGTTCRRHLTRNSEQPNFSCHGTREEGPNPKLQGRAQPPCQGHLTTTFRCRVWRDFGPKLWNDLSQGPHFPRNASAPCSDGKCHLPLLVTQRDPAGPARMTPLF